MNIICKLFTRRVFVACGQGGVAAGGVDEDGTGAALHLGRGGHHERSGICDALKNAVRVYRDRLKGWS